MKVINLIGEPGVGKSSTAAGVYSELSIRGYRAEYVPEVAKGYAWETPKDKDGNALAHPIFQQQLLILGEQNRYLERLRHNRDIVIVDSPLIIAAIYKPEGYLKSFEKLVLEQFHTYDNINIFLERNHPFDPEGRVHNEEQSKEVRKKFLKYMKKNDLPYVSFKTHKKISKEIAKFIIKNYL